MNALHKWRGPHDPPGTFFRREQTRELYGYEPREIFVAAASFQVDPREVAPQFSPISGESNALESNELAGHEAEGDPFDGAVLRLVTANYVAPKPDPVIVAIMARRAVDWLRDNRTEEIASYVADLEKSMALLRREMQSPSRLERVMKSVFGNQR